MILLSKHQVLFFDSLDMDGLARLLHWDLKYLQALNDLSLHLNWHLAQVTIDIISLLLLALGGKLPYWLLMKYLAITSSASHSEILRYSGI